MQKDNIHLYLSSTLVVMYLSVIIFWLKSIQILTNSSQRNFVVMLFSDDRMITGSDPSQAIKFFLSQNVMTHQGTLLLEVKLGNDHFNLYI